MGSKRKYNTDMLRQISQIDTVLAIKKEGEEGLFLAASEYVDFAEDFLKKYGDGGIIEHFKSFLEDAEALKERVGKLYATTIIWDIDELVKTFKSGNKDTIQEKYDNLSVSVDALLKRLNRSECDEAGNLLIKPREKSDIDDEELASQPECGKTVSGNFLPLEKVEIIAKLVDDLDFDEALRLSKLLSTVYYSEAVNIEIKKLIWIMKMGEFEKASVSAQRIIEEAKNHNKAVEAQTEEVKPRLLVVDDVVDMLLTIKGVLIDMCHVCTVTNHVSALRFLENCHADIIMLDIGLPEVDGFELFDMIKKMDKYKDTPIMFLTGDVSKETIVKAIDVGIADYLRKPFDAITLISRVQRLLRTLEDWKE